MMSLYYEERGIEAILEEKALLVLVMAVCPTVVLA